MGLCITAEHVEAFASAYLSPGYYKPHPFAAFHRECWGWYCNEALPEVAVAAPRYHGKSIALTDAFVTTALSLRWRRYVVIFSATESLAMQHLARTADSFKFNDDLKRDLHVVGLDADTKTDVIVRFRDGYDCRLMAFGSGQRVRGLNWKGMRPDLILGDDLESDDDVTTKEIRENFRYWFLRVAQQLLGEGGLIRVHGTILHEDSLLRNLCNSWPGRVYKAHAGYTDFSQILWPARFNEAELRKIQKRFLDGKDPAGYAQELLNAPRDRLDPYLSRDWFLPLDTLRLQDFRHYGVGVDLAISQADHANSTAFVVGGLGGDGMLDITDVRKGRWDSLRIIETFFDVQDFWNPQAFFVERGAIFSAIEPVLKSEMRRRNQYLNLVQMTPIKDKATRGRALQKRMRAGGMRFNKEAEWYPGYESELLFFTAEADALADDQFDATAWLVLGMEDIRPPEWEDQLTPEESAWYSQSDAERGAAGSGRSLVTGY